MAASPKDIAERRAQFRKLLRFAGLAWALIALQVGLAILNIRGLFKTEEQAEDPA